MAFMDSLKDFIKTNGSVYTVRKYNMPAATIEIEEVGICYRTRLGEIKSKEELLPYVDQSGFESLDEWWSKIKRFIPTNGPYFLYKVEKA